MKHNVYEEFNDMTIELDDYDYEEVDELRSKRWIKNAKKSVSKRTVKKRIKAMVAIGILFIWIGGYTLPVYAMMDPVLHKIADFIGVNRKLETYSNVVNQVVTKKGITVQLGEVLVDSDEIAVTLRVTSKDPLPQYFSIRDADIYINGQVIKTNYLVSEREINNHTFEFCMEWLVEDILKDDLDIRVVFKEFGSYEEQIEDKWTFDFNTNGEALMVETFQIPVRETIYVPGGGKIFVEKYTANKLSQKIYFEIIEPVKDVQIEFELHNANGNRYKSQLASIAIQGEGVFKWEGLNDEDLNDILALNLKVAKYGEQYQQVDHEIRIDLSDRE